MNIFLLVKINSLNIQQEELTTKLIAVNNSHSIDVTFLMENASISHPQITIPSDKLRLLIFIPQSSCADCLIYEIPNINKLYTKYEDYIDIYLYSREGGIEEYYDIEFDYKLLYPNEFIFDQDINIVNPIAVLIDSDSTIHSIYMSEIGNVIKSNNFFEKMNTLLGLL